LKSVDVEGGDIFVFAVIVSLASPVADAAVEVCVNFCLGKLNCLHYLFLLPRSGGAVGLFGGGLRGVLNRTVPNQVEIQRVEALRIVKCAAEA